MPMFRLHIATPLSRSERRGLRHQPKDAVLRLEKTHTIVCRLERGGLLGARTAFGHMLLDVQYWAWEHEDVIRVESRYELAWEFGQSTPLERLRAKLEFPTFSIDIDDVW